MDNYLWTGLCVGFWFGVIWAVLTSLGRRGLFGQGYDRDGFFCLHPSLTALWRIGRDENGKRLDGVSVETEMWPFGA